jgi:RNA polymerase sigma-70 factor (ECF subfamily)
MAGRADIETLVEQARDGSSAAWGKVYEALAPSVYRLGRRLLRSSEDAEDATTEIFLKARLHLSQYERGRPFPPWLYRVAANHCWDELRKRRRHGERDVNEGELDKLEDDGPTPQETVLANETRDALREAIAALDDRSRMAVVLRYFADFSYAQIAEVLDISATFVGVVLLRARRQMRRHLEQA